MIKKFSVGACIVLMMTTQTSLLANEDAFPDKLTVCADELGFAPYTFDLPGSRGTARGYNLDVLKAALAPYQVDIDVVMRPWLRCLSMAAQGEVDIVFDVADHPTRREIFFLADSHYRIRAALIAPKSNHERLRNIREREQVNTINICELAGWPSPLDDVQGYQPAGRPRDMKAAQEMMLTYNRCDAILYSLEVFVGSLQVGTFPADIAELFEYHLFSKQPTRNHHFGISKNSPFAGVLNTHLDTSIVKMRESGLLDLLLASYLPAEMLSPEND